MAEFPDTFDPAAVPEDDRSFDPIPAGDYQMQVIESEIKPTKSGDGQMLVLTLEVMTGPHEKRRVWDRLNIRNANADAQRIAQRALADLCLATGIASLKDSDELHFKPFTARIGIREDKSGQYGPQNTVRYKPKGGTAPSGQQQKPAAQQQTSASKPAQGAKPWAKAS